jgi:hypothetical protein
MGNLDAMLPRIDAKLKYFTILKTYDLISLDAMNTSNAIDSKIGVEVSHWGSHYVSQLRIVHILLLLLLALTADYVRMLYMRRRMVVFQSFTTFSTDQTTATRPLSMANMRQHFQSSKRQAVVLL